VELAAALACGVARELLGGCPAAPAGPADLRIAPAAREDAREEMGEAASFFHGSLRAVVRAGRFVLRDGATEVRVSEDGRLLEVAGAASAGEGSELAVLVGLVLALRHHGLFHLHAAALQAPGGAGVLIAGASGAGKTTLALALAAAGLAPLADDAVLAFRRGSAPAVAGIPRPFHLAGRTAGAFRALAPLLGPASPTGKRPLPLQAFGPPAAAAPACVPALLLLPEIAPAGPTTAEPASPADALGALLECGALLAADGMPAVPEQLAVLRAIADTARAARVRLGEDLLREPAAVARAVLAAVAPRERLAER
jgi:hypothetical protein